MGSRAILLLLGLLLLSTELLAQQRGNCSLPPDKGPCKAAITYYYYDTNVETCRRFLYGGCRGNSNRFRSKKACMYACVKKGRKK
ncbi:isoinhibitor K-like [Sphaerodactylus townsendi]|uniref:isoinhibitor K-like n=1 Tax=Sphaerodactylus townsendi TaxID=933632 RepID=UPI002026ADE8|nr:isoinhibitor K-like [Sphaerodactylus townsendi]